MLRANARKCCGAEIGSAWKVESGEKIVFSRQAAAVGAADCAVTQAEHLADSLLFE